MKILQKLFFFVVIVLISANFSFIRFSNNKEKLHCLNNYTNEFLVLNKDCKRLYYDFLLNKAQKQFDNRKIIVSESYKDKKCVQEYQSAIRMKLEDLINSLPNKTPLNAKTTKIIECDGYRIENIIFESRPNLYITGNLYIPTKFKGPFPAILQACGHEINGKAYEKYQRAAILLAINGFTVLVIDTYSQGERAQCERGSVSHTQIDIGAMLVGTDLVAYQAWDNIRAIDYLCSRPEVDSMKIGVTGNSGGGTQTMYMMAFDDRVKAIASSCGLHTRERMFTWNGLADGCHNFAYEGEKMLEFADYFILFAPKPALVLAGEKDQAFDVTATAKTVREAKWFYNELGAFDHLDIFTVDKGHGFHKELREAAVWWFKKWLMDDNSLIKEPKLVIQPDEELWATKSGQLYQEIQHSKSIIDINIQQANDYKINRKSFWENNTKQQCIKKVKELIRCPDEPNIQEIQYKHVGDIIKKGITIKKLELLARDGFPIPVLMYIPINEANTSIPASLYLNDKGKNYIFNSDSLLMNVVRNKRIIIAPDLRGFGETFVDLGKLRKDAHEQNHHHQIAQTALYIGETLVGQRVKDVIDVLNHLMSYPQVDKSDIELIATGHYGPIALHATAIDSRINSLKVINSITSFMDIIKEPKAKDQFKNVVPNAMKYYDYIDLIHSIYPRSVSIINPVDAYGKIKNNFSKATQLAHYQ